MINLFGLKTLPSLWLRNSLFIVSLSSLITISCTQSHLDKYESDWIVIKYQKNGLDETENISFANFSINPVYNVCTPMSVYIDYGKKTKILSSEIQFERRAGEDYMFIKDHPYFSGEYLLQCIDNNCCTISLSNDSIYLEMDYNGPYFHAKPRNCPKPRFGSNKK